MQHVRSKLRWRVVQTVFLNNWKLRVYWILNNRSQSRFNAWRSVYYLIIWFIYCMVVNLLEVSAGKMWAILVEKFGNIKIIWIFHVQFLFRDNKSRKAYDLWLKEQKLREKKGIIGDKIIIDIHTSEVIEYCRLKNISMFSVFMLFNVI